MVQEWFADSYSSIKGQSYRNPHYDPTDTYHHSQAGINIVNSGTSSTTTGDKMSAQKKVKLVVYGALATSLLAIIVLL